jgi:hypothetical protein
MHRDLRSMFVVCFYECVRMGGPSEGSGGWGGGGCTTAGHTIDHRKRSAFLQTLKML